MQPALSATKENRLICAALLALFVLSASLAAFNKDVTRGFDELAHTSYVATLQSGAKSWPRLEELRMLDAKTFRFTDEVSYLNHPPLFYLPLARLGPQLENRPHAVVAHRLINVGIGAAALALAIALGLFIGLTRIEFLAYAVPLFAIPALIPLAGSVNNDNLAAAGGALAVLGAYGLLQRGRFAWLLAMLAGVAIASAAKLTGLLLAGAFAAIVIAYLIWKKQFRASWIPAIAIALLISAAPYIAFTLQYGSPAPNTPAQLLLLKSGAETAGWANQPRLSLPAYAAQFAWAFITEWMPALAPRNALHYAMLALPIAAALFAFAGIYFAARRLVRGKQDAADVVALAGIASLAATFAIHLWFSYGRHLETGWMMDAYPRYYFPMLAILPLAAILALREIGQPKLRNALAAFLIISPLVFRIFGAPLAAA